MLLFQPFHLIVIPWRSIIPNFYMIEAYRYFLIYELLLNCFGHRFGNNRSLIILNFDMIDLIESQWNYINKIRLFKKLLKHIGYRWNSYHATGAVLYILYTYLRTLSFEKHAKPFCNIMLLNYRFNWASTRTTPVQNNSWNLKFTAKLLCWL